MQDIIIIIIIMYKSVKKKSVFENYLSNTPKYANQIQIFHLVSFQIQIQIQIFVYLNTNTNTNTYLTPALDHAIWWFPAQHPRAGTILKNLPQTPT